MMRSRTAGTAAAITRIRESEDRQTEAFSDPDSLSGRVEAVNRAFNREYPSDHDTGVYNYVEEIYEDRVLARVGEDTLEIDYSVADDAKVSFGDSRKVKVGLSVSAVEDSTESTDTKPERIKATEEPEGVSILEALDDGEGRVWRVVMVRPGVSKNRRRYRREVLAEAVALYEGAKAFDGHRDNASRRASSVAGLAGWHENVSIGADGAIESDFHIAESREDIRQLFLTAWRNQRPDLIGFSHDVGAITEAVIVDGQKLSDVRKIVEVHSVDVVADPSAGGRIERLVASRQKEETMKLEDFLRALRAGELSKDQIEEAFSENPEWEKVVEAVGIDLENPSGEGDGSGDPDPEPVTEAGGATGLTGAVRDLVISQRLSEANLPKEAQDRLREALKEETDENAIISKIKETTDIWQAAMAARPSQLPGQNVEIGESDREKLQKGLDAMMASKPEIDGVPAFRSLKEAYVAFTGRNPYGMGEEDFNRWVLAESVGAVPYQGAQRISESLTSASWAEALGDSIHRQMVAEYAMDALQSWRQIVSEVGNLSDFRDNHRVRVGGYDTLPVVAEGGPYTALTSPTDEEATLAGTKKGGTEDLTLETIANDDLGAVRRIPRKLGRAAALTLYRAIWNTTIAGNALIYDGVALFAAGHGNENATTPLDEDGITTLRNAMMAQQIAGETSGFIGLMPKFLVVPTALYVPAFKLAESNVAVVSGENATTPNPHVGLSVIEVPTFTDTNDWFMVADPRTTPTIEVGFYQGRQDPELFVQDQPNVGSVFTNDVITYKIRHIWGLAVLDYRGFQRATQV